MGRVIQLPSRRVGQPIYSGERLQTAGKEWIRREKKLLDRIEFLEAMVMVLDDVRIKNIQDGDYGMMEIVLEEITRYIERMDQVRRDLEAHRARFGQSILALAEREPVDWDRPSNG